MASIKIKIEKIKEAYDEIGKALYSTRSIEDERKGHWIEYDVEKAYGGARCERSILKFKEDMLSFDWRKIATSVHLLFDGEYFMAEKMSKTSPFKKGRATGRKSGSGSQFIGLKDGESIVFAPLIGLEGMISADMHEYWDIRPAIFHPCIGKDCPGEQAGNEPRFKGYLPVVKKAGEVLVFPFTISVYNLLEELEDEIDGDLKGYVIKFSRRGTGFSTKYSILGLGKRIEVDDVEIPDFVSQLGPQERKEILTLLEVNDVEIVGPDKVDKTVAERIAEDLDKDSDKIEVDDDDWDV